MKALFLTTVFSLALTGAAAACDGVVDVMCNMPAMTYAIAQGDPNFSFKVVSALQDAWSLAAAKKFAAARDRMASTAKIVKKTPYEVAAIADLVAVADFGLSDYNAAADNFAAGIETGTLPRQGVIKRLAAMTQLYWETNTFDKTIVAGDQYTRLAGQDVDILMIVGKAHYAKREFPQAADAFHAAVNTARESHIPVKEDWLKLLMSGDYYMHNTPGVITALEQLVENYPKPEYAADLQRYKEYEVASEQAKAGSR